MSTKKTFKPGLFGIGLNIEKKFSDHCLDIGIQQLTNYFNVESVYIKPTILNLKAVFFFHKDLGRRRACSILENLFDDYPSNLNALADLIYVYQQMGREKVAEKYKDRLESLKDEPLLQAESVLSQAHALTIDFRIDHNKNSEVLLKDTWRLLNMKGNHLKQVIKANSLVVEAYKLVKSIPETTLDKNTQSKNRAIDMFEEGIKNLEELHCPPKTIVAWKFNLAIAQCQLETWDNEYDNLSENCIQALENYSYVIENLSPVEEQEQSMKRYFAKSSISFAVLYISRKTLIDNAHLSDSIKKRVRDVYATADKAIEVCPYDHSVLNRCGRYKNSRYQYRAAIDLYNESIKLVPDKYINWFAYTSRSRSYYSLYILMKKQQVLNDEICEYLNHAYMDGQICLQSKRTEKDMIYMAQICFEKAMPAERSDSFYCQDINFIYEALELLNEILSKRDITKDSTIHFLLGKYYAYISEYRKAVESLKMSLELNMWSMKYPRGFNFLCKSLIVFYKRDKNGNLLSEFRFILKEAEKRTNHIWVKTGIRMISQHAPRMLFNLVKNMIEWDAKNCRTIIEQALSMMPYNKTLREQFETKLQEGKSEDSERNGLAEIEISDTSEISVYDFFVLHSEEDKDWVNCMLRPQLEDYDDKIKFRGFIPCRDFVPGEKVLSSILKGMEKCRKLLIILTPHHVNSRLFKYYLGERAIHSLADAKARDKAIIPIVLEDCEIPDMFKPFTPIFFNREINWEQLRMNLTVNMDSEVEFEEKMSALPVSDLDEN